MNIKTFLSVTLIMTSSTIFSAEKFEASFARGQWSKDDFYVVKSPRFAKVETFSQKDDHIVNTLPPELSKQAFVTSADSYCAMLTKKKFSGNITVSSKMSFDQRMAPLIVIAPELGFSADCQYPELRDHYEIVLFDEGINIWHHRYKDGKPSWYLLAYLAAEFKKETIYELSITLKHTHRGPSLTIKCDGHEFSCAMPVEFTAKDYHVGIIGCEGVNRFYDLKVR